MEKLNALLSKKIGGVPVLAIAALFAGVVLFYAVRMKPTAPQEETVDVSEVEEGGDSGGDPADYSQPVFQATPTITQPTNVGSSVSGIAVQDSNELWKTRVLQDLLSKGYSYNIAAGMVDKFLNGESLTPAEAKVRDVVVQNYGMPPEGVEFAADQPAATSSTAIPAVTPKPAAKAVRQIAKPPGWHTVKGSQDNTAEELALLYYGYVTSANKARIRALNVSGAGAPPWKTGTKVWIPDDKEPKYYKTTPHVKSIQAIAKKNGVTPAQISTLNPKKKFPVPSGTSVRVS